MSKKILFNEKNNYVWKNIMNEKKGLICKKNYLWKKNLFKKIMYEKKNMYLIKLLINCFIFKVI